MYTVSFQLNEVGSSTLFSQLAIDDNNNGLDLLVYAGAIPTAVAQAPEPASLALLALV
jgi:hypothetical protein